MTNKQLLLDVNKMGREITPLGENCFFIPEDIYDVLNNLEMVRESGSIFGVRLCVWSKDD